MRYYIDLEFYEVEKPNKVLGITVSHSKIIDFVSIGIISQNSDKYYAINEDSYLLSLQNPPKWMKDNVISKLNNDPPSAFKSVEMIKSEILNFMKDDFEPRFYGYYADYDWVVFCSIFGGMLEVPAKFPKYCVDVKQNLDNKISKLHLTKENIGLVSLDKYKYANFDEKLKWVQSLPNYPKHIREHHALFDAMFAKEMDQFIKKAWKNESIHIR